METVQLTVTLTRSSEFGLGIEISGGTDCGGKDTGIYVNAVIAGGPAEGKLRPGDLLLGCNGNSLRRVTHDAAITQLQRHSLISLLVERKLDQKAALAVTTAFESGIQQAEDSRGIIGDDNTDFVVEVTFSVRSLETQKSHLVVSKTLESINGVSVQQMASPAHLARLIDSSQSTTLRYKLPPGLVSQTSSSSSGKSDTTTTAGWNGNADVNKQQQPSPSQVAFTRQKGEKEKLALGAAAQKSPMLPAKPQAALLNGQYGVNTGNQKASNQEKLGDRRGSDLQINGGRRAGFAGIQEEGKKSTLSLKSEQDDMISQQIEQTRTRRVGRVFSPLEAEPVDLTAAVKGRPAKDSAVAEKTVAPSQLKNDQSFIHRKIDKPVTPADLGQQQTAQKSQGDTNGNAAGRLNSTRSQEEQPSKRQEDLSPAPKQATNSSVPKNQQKLEQVVAQVLADNSGNVSPVALRHSKLDQGPSNFSVDPRERTQSQSVNQQRKADHRPVSLYEEKTNKQAQSPSRNSHHKSDQMYTGGNPDSGATDRAQSPPFKQKRKMAHQPLSYFDANNSRDQTDEQLRQGKNFESEADSGSSLDRRSSESPGSVLSSQNRPTGPRERIRSQKEEPLETSFTVGGYKFEQPVTVSSTVLEQNRLVLPDSSGSIGVKLDGGNAVGIYVQQVTPGAAADRAGIRPGDRLLAVDDKSLVGATKEEALLTLLRAKGRALQVKLVSDSIGHRSFLASKQPGDRFHVRAHFSHTPPASNESAFKRNDVFLVRDTLAGDMIGSWEALRVHPPPVDTEARLIPCANRADQIVMATAGSELPTAFPPYERVVQRRVTFCRPVVILGPFADLIRKYLIKTLPDRFEQPEQAGETVKLSVIRDVVSRGKHCVLDLNPVALDRLCFAQLAPIVLFVRAAHRMIVKKVRKESGSKKLFLESQRIERWCSHLFTGVFTIDQPDLSPLLDGLDGLIHLQQGQLLWLGEKDECPVRALSEPKLCCSKPSSESEKQLNFSGFNSPTAETCDDKEEDWRQEWRRFDEGHRSGSMCSIASRHADDAGDPFDAWQPLQKERELPSQLPISQCSGIFDFSGGSLRCSRTGAELEIPAGAFSVGRLVRLHLAVLSGRTLLLGPPGIRFLRPVIVWLPPTWRNATLVTANLSESGQVSDWAELNWPDVSASRRGDNETVICMTGDRFEPV